MRKTYIVFDEKQIETMENEKFTFHKKDGAFTNILLASSVSYIPPSRWNVYQKFASKGDHVKYRNLFGTIKESRTETYEEDMYISDFSERLGDYEDAITKEELISLLKMNGIDLAKIIFDKDGFLYDTHSVVIVDAAGVKYAKHFKRKSDALKYMEKATESLTLYIR